MDDHNMESLLYAIFYIFIMCILWLFFFRRVVRYFFHFCSIRNDGSITIITRRQHHLHHDKEAITLSFLIQLDMKVIWLK